MRKLLYLLLILSLMISIFGCSQQNDPAQEPGSEETSPEVNGLDDQAKTATAEAAGFGGIISVKLTVENGVITDCVVDGPGETEGIGSTAVAKLPERIKEANSVEVDGVSGCTMSSNAILSAAKEAYAQIMD